MNMADHDKELEHLFAQARATRDTFPDELAVRIETDAEAIRLERVGFDRIHVFTRHALRRIASVSRQTWRQRLRDFGGWQGLGGLVVASAAGVWIGFFAPAFLPDPAEYLVSEEAIYLMADLNLDDNYLEDAE